MTQATKFYIAVNSYRSSTSDGFGNTWQIFWVDSKADQARILKEGLPVSDQEYIHDDGKRTSCFSTKGIRVLTPAERQAVKRDPELAQHLNV